MQEAGQQKMALFAPFGTKTDVFASAGAAMGAN